MKLAIADLAEYLGVKIETVATVIVSISVFILGIVINQLINAYNSYRKRGIVRKLTSINHKTLIRQSVRQARNFSNFQEQLNIQHDGHFTYQYKMNPALAVFQELGYKEVYNAYFTGLENFSLNNSQKVSAFNNLWNSIEYLRQTWQESSERAVKYIGEIAKHNEERNLIVGKAQELIEQFRLNFNLQLDIREPLGQFYDERERIIANHLRKENSKLPHHVNEYLSEIINLNRKNVELARRYDRDINSVKLNSYILESAMRYENMNNYITAAHLSFQFLSQEYFNTYNSLRASYRVLARGRARFPLLVKTEKTRILLITLSLLLIILIMSK